jgi:NAD-dependent dihydropyrimidine dehydrogenase PreA subunit
MRTDAIFIGIEVADEIAGDAAMAAKLEEVCPVDIYADDGGRVRIVDANIDECVLCRLCIDATPRGTVKVHKLYDNGPDAVLSSDPAAAG